MIDRPDAALRDLPVRERITFVRSSSGPLLRALAVSIGRRVDELRQEYRRALVASDEIEAFTEALGELLEAAAASPLAFIEQQQRRLPDGDEGGLR